MTIINNIRKIIKISKSNVDGKIFFSIMNYFNKQNILVRHFYRFKLGAKHTKFITTISCWDENIKKNLDRMPLDLDYTRTDIDAKYKTKNTENKNNEIKTNDN